MRVNSPRFPQIVPVISLPVHLRISCSHLVKSMALSSITLEICINSVSSQTNYDTHVCRNWLYKRTRHKAILIMGDRLFNSADVEVGSSNLTKFATFPRLTMLLTFDTYVRTAKMIYIPSALSYSANYIGYKRFI